MPGFLYVVGTRPNFMKVAPVLAAMRSALPEVPHRLVHTGQHYDAAMSTVFFDELGMPEPDHHLGVGAGRPGAQTAYVLERIEALLVEDPPDLVVVPGDVTSTLAAALAASKQDVPVAHVEAGLRSYDRTMPEEVNRVLTDQLSEVLLTHSPEALGNLEREGIPAERVRFVGNTMIDTLARLLPAATPHLLEELDLPERYLLVTLHRPALVDGPKLDLVLQELEAIAEELPVVFPVHPRTRARIDASGLALERVRLLPPVGYLAFVALQRMAAGVLTDSGGVQEETTYLGVPCFTLRDNTERPVTCDEGTNVLLGLRPEAIAGIPARIREAVAPRTPPRGWDGRAAERVVAELAPFAS